MITLGYAYSQRSEKEASDTIYAKKYGDSLRKKKLDDEINSISSRSEFNGGKKFQKPFLGVKKRPSDYSASKPIENTPQERPATGQISERRTSGFLQAYQRKVGRGNGGRYNKYSETPSQDNSYMNGSTSEYDKVYPSTTQNRVLDTDYTRKGQLDELYSQDRKLTKVYSHRSDISARALNGMPTSYHPSLKSSFAHNGASKNRYRSIGESEDETVEDYRLKTANNFDVHSFRSKRIA